MSDMYESLYSTIVHVEDGYKVPSLNKEFILFYFLFGIRRLMLFSVAAIFFI